MIWEEEDGERMNHSYPQWRHPRALLDAEDSCPMAAADLGAVIILMSGYTNGNDLHYTVSHVQRCG